MPMLLRYGVAVAGDVEAGDGGAPGARPEEGREHVDRRRLAGAVGTEQAEELPLFDGERDAVHGGESVERFHQSCRADGVHKGSLETAMIPFFGAVVGGRDFG